MGQVITLVLFVLGLAILIKGADWLVSGAASIARRFGVPDLTVGLTIVAFGTSAPELVVNILASLRGSTDLAIGNVIGSNIANILLILGVAAIIRPIHAERDTVWKEIPFCLLAAILMAILPNDAILQGGTESAITRIDGLVLLCFLSVFLYYVYEAAKHSDGETPLDDVPEEMHTLPMSGMLVAAGIVGLTLGGKWVVDGAVTMASAFSISEELIGLTVVAIGTSLPELATAAVAARKGKSAIVVGNAVGSNIFNIFMVLGISSTIAELPLDLRANTDIGVMIIATVLLFAVMFIGAPRYVVGRAEGAFFLIVYVAYIVLITLAELNGASPI